MNKEIYKGVIHSLLPQKGFGFITPVWANGDSEENIFFHLSETKGGKCFIPALASAENRNEIITKKGTKIYVPKEPQVVFFGLEFEELPDGTVKSLAVKIKDSKHVSDEEAEQADANSSKPSLDWLDELGPAEERVDLTVTTETIQQPEQEEKPDNCEAASQEEVVEETVEENVDDNTTIKENDCDCIALTEYEGGEPVSYTKSDKELDAWLDADPEHSWFPVNYDDKEEDEESDGDIIQDEYDRLDAKSAHPYRPKENKDR